ncbi:amidohydrolase family protein [Glutamicibacter creatinolyticus]|uniref:amidohydrolase family protein n=1 Tax=Glutamicibacter creatinolyticus TaxID=162496 RepID=UPI0037BE7430
MYESRIDLDSITAIDTHVHIEADDCGHGALPPELNDAMDAYFKRSGPVPNLDAVADYYRELSMAAVVFTVDARTAMKTMPNSSEEIALGAARNNDVLIPFGSVDPLRGAAAIEHARQLHGEFGVRGFKFHPSVQDFLPSDPQFEPLFTVLEELGLPTVFHTGQTGIGAGMPGGFGIRMSLSNPMHLDDLAARHPQLKIIMAHPSVPWQDEAIAIASHKANVFIDLSGWSPKYFEPKLVQAARTYLQDKVLFGSDFPAITPERWMRDYARLEIPEEATAKIFKTNAARLLELV